MLDNTLCTSVAREFGSVDAVVARLKVEQFHVAGLHGEKQQWYREAVMRLFREGAVPVLSP